MPEITIQQSTFERLQRYAKPFVDTPDTVIARALDVLDQVGRQNAPDTRGKIRDERQLDPRTLPNLTHSKVLSASVGGNPVVKPNWNRVLDEVLRQAMKHAGSFERLRHLCPVSLVRGRKEDEGFRYLPDVDVSVQGQPANGAGHAMVTAAQASGIHLDIGIMWRLKEGAGYPGERGRIVVGQSKVPRETTDE